MGSKIFTCTCVPDSNDGGLDFSDNIKSNESQKEKINKLFVTNEPISKLSEENNTNNTNKSLYKKKTVDSNYSCREQNEGSTNLKVTERRIK